MENNESDSNIIASVIHNKKLKVANNIRIDKYYSNYIVNRREKIKHLHSRHNLKISFCTNIKHFIKNREFITTVTQVRLS